MEKDVIAYTVGLRPVQVTVYWKMWKPVSGCVSEFLNHSAECKLAVGDRETIQGPQRSLSALSISHFQARIFRIYSFVCTGGMALHETIQRFPVFFFLRRSARRPSLAQPADGDRTQWAGE